MGTSLSQPAGGWAETNPPWSTSSLAPSERSETSLTFQAHMSHRRTAEERQSSPDRKTTRSTPRITRNNKYYSFIFIYWGWFPMWQKAPRYRVQWMSWRSSWVHATSSKWRITDRLVAGAPGTKRLAPSPHPQRAAHSGMWASHRERNLQLWQPPTICKSFWTIFCSRNILEADKMC